MQARSRSAATERPRRARIRLSSRRDRASVHHPSSIARTRIIPIANTIAETMHWLKPQIQYWGAVHHQNKPPTTPIGPKRTQNQAARAATSLHGGSGFGASPFPVIGSNRWLFYWRAASCHPGGQSFAATRICGPIVYCGAHVYAEIQITWYVLDRRGASKPTIYTAALPRRCAGNADRQLRRLRRLNGSLFRQAVRALRALQWFPTA